MRALVLTGLMAIGGIAHGQQKTEPKVDARFADKADKTAVSLTGEFAYAEFSGVRDKSKKLHIAIKDMNENGIYGDAGDKVVSARYTTTELGQKMYLGDKSYEVLFVNMSSFDWKNSKCWNSLVKDADKVNRRTLRKGHVAFFENFSAADYAEDETLVQNHAATTKALALINAEFGLNLTREPIGTGNGGPRLRGN